MKGKLTKKKPTKVKIDKEFEKNFGNTNLKIWRVHNDKELVEKTFEKLKEKLGGEDISLYEDKIRFPCSRYRIPTDRKHYNVFFSGGYDSLSLAIRHLEKGDLVDLYYLNFDPEMTIFAKISCAILQSIYGKNVIGLKSVLNDDPLGAAGDVEFKFAQQRLTTFLASMIKDDVLEKTIATEIAYCRNDDAISFLSELRNLYNASLSCRLDTTAKVPLKFPLSKISHFNNSEVVYTFEEKCNVIFPVTEYYLSNIHAFKTKDEKWLLMEPGDRSDVELHANKEVANPTMTYIIRIKDVSPKKLEQVCNCEDMKVMDRAGAVPELEHVCNCEDTEEVDVGTN